MTEKSGGNSIFRIGFGILISIGSLTALILLTDADQIWAALRQVRLITVLITAGLVILSLFTRAYAWRGILQDRINLWQSYLIINAGYFVNTILPFRLGEISRAFLLMPFGMNFWEAFPTIVLERLIDLIFALGLFFIGLPFALELQLNTSYYVILAGLVLLGFLILFLMIRKRTELIHWLEQTSILGDKLRTRLVKFAQSVSSSMQVLNQPRRMGRVLLGMTLSWAVALSLQFILLRAFLPEAKFIWVVFTLGALAVGVSVPSSPGNIGIFEASITLALSAFGVDQSLAFSYALTSHIISLIISTVFGAYGLVRQGVGLREVWQFGIRQDRGEPL